jgi:hypothetical protein
MSQFRIVDGITEELVFTMFITVKGKRIYRKNGRPFSFWAPVK